jgi:plasmid stabilization system protein ParE
MTRLVVTSDAEADTTEILAYLAQEAGANVATEFGRRFRVAVERLLDFPQSGAPQPRLGSETRIAIVAPYVLIYDYTREDDLTYAAPHSSWQAGHHAQTC